MIMNVKMTEIKNAATKSYYYQCDKFTVVVLRMKKVAPYGAWAGRAVKADGSEIACLRTDTKMTRRELFDDLVTMSVQACC
jgi:hypothetical protein